MKMKADQAAAQRERRTDGRKKSSTNYSKTMQTKHVCLENFGNPLETHGLLDLFSKRVPNICAAQVFAYTHTPSRALYFIR